MTLTTSPSSIRVTALEQYYENVRDALHRTAATHAAIGFHPAFELPPLTPETVAFLAGSLLCFTELGDVDGVRLVLLDLMRNPRTRTTKTIASLVMVARAAHHIRTTGEAIMIVTPSSANKATALRDAVLRAYECGLVTPAQLQIVTVVPALAREKLWKSDLDGDALRPRNPMCVHDGDHPSDVKALAETAVRAVEDDVRAATGTRLWYSLSLDNYRPADTVRAFAEHDLFPPTEGLRRCHAHSVSSAYGLLGHHYGTELLGSDGPACAYFLVQHLATPDMVLSLRYGTPDHSAVPTFHLDEPSGLYRQDTDPRFPAATFEPDENMEPTFYTRAPVTSALMDPVIARQGGDGIVVSLYECLQRYPAIRQMLTGVVSLPADPRRLREWSLVMAMTGVLNGIERGLLQADEVVVHGSGSYSTDDFAPIPTERLTNVPNPDVLADVLLAAATAALPS